jgi:hypothetical protein
MCPLHSADAQVAPIRYQLYKHIIHYIQCSTGTSKSDIRPHAHRQKCCWPASYSLKTPLSTNAPQSPRHLQRCMLDRLVLLPLTGPNKGTQRDGLSLSLTLPGVFRRCFTASDTAPAGETPLRRPALEVHEGPINRKDLSTYQWERV